MIEIEQVAHEKSTICIYVTLLDIDETETNPKSMLWTLVDSSGNIMNSREQVVVAAGSLGTALDSEGRASTLIVLSGDDLVLSETEETSRKVTRDGASRRVVIEATYDSSVGTDLPVTGAGEFFVTNLPYLTA